MLKAPWWYPVRAVWMVVEPHLLLEEEEEECLQLKVLFAEFSQELFNKGPVKSEYLCTHDGWRPR